MSYINFCKYSQAPHFSTIKYLFTKMLKPVELAEELKSAEEKLYVIIPIYGHIVSYFSHKTFLIAMRIKTKIKGL